MTGKSIKVSVVVAAYNEEKYISHTLDSILSQNVNFDYEVLVGDDCSKDNTAAIIREYTEKYPDIIIPFIRESNMGMTGNSLDLIGRAKGEYLALVEGDDYWIDDNKLQKQADFLDSNPDYVACFGKCIIVDEDDVRHPEQEEYSGFIKHDGDYTIKDFEDYLLPGQTATSMYRRETILDLLNKVINSQFDMRKFIDRHLVLMMYASGKQYNSGEEIAAYRRIMKKGSGSWSSKNDYYSLENLMNFIEGLKDLEKIADTLEIKLNFDERRKYEWDKLLKHQDEFSKNEIEAVKKILMNDFNDRLGMILFRFKKFLGK